MTTEKSDIIFLQDQLIKTQIEVCRLRCRLDNQDEIIKLLLNSVKKQFNEDLKKNMINGNFKKNNLLP